MPSSPLLCIYRLTRSVRQSSHQQIQLTTRWWSIDRSDLLLTPVSKTYAHRSDDMTTKSIIYLWPKVAWYQVHLWATLCLVVHGVCNGQSMTSTEVKKQNTAWVLIREPVPPNYVPPNHCIIAHISIGVPLKNSQRLMSIPTPAQCLFPWATPEYESPGPLQEFGFRAHAVCGGEPNYI